MDAYDFSKPIGDKEGTSYHFGIDNSNVSDTLREIADKLDKGELAVQGCKVMSTASKDEFSYTVLRVAFSEKRKSKNKQLSFFEQFNSIAPIMGGVTKPPDDFIESVEYGKQLLVQMHLDGLDLEKKEKLKHLYGAEMFPVATKRIE